jgi:large subunit ribosomal protein L17
MRHLKRTAKLGRTSEHRNAMLANLVCSLIKHKRITTTLAKAKAARPVAEKMITLGKRGTIHARRLAASRLRARGRSLELSKEQRKKWRQNEDVVRILFDEIAPVFKDRRGGYTRIIRLGERRGDVAKQAILEWVELPSGDSTEPAAPTPAAESAETASTEKEKEEKTAEAKA